MLEKHSKCGLSVSFNQKLLVFLDYIRRAALFKIKIVKLIIYHRYCLLCNLLFVNIAL